MTHLLALTKMNAKFLTILIAAMLGGTAMASDAPVELPEMKVDARRPGRFSTRSVVSPDGAVRVYVVPVRTPSCDSTYLYGDFMVGDEIVRLDGRDVSALKRGELSGQLRVGAKVVVKRRVALQRFDLVEVECRRAEPLKTPESAPTSVTSPAAQGARQP
jgi:hypothetical protein